MALKDEKEQHPFVKEAKLSNNKYDFTRVSTVERATVYTENEIIVFFATDTTLKERVDVFEVVYKEEPVTVTLQIGEIFHLGGRK